MEDEAEADLMAEAEPVKAATANWETGAAVRADAANWEMRAEPARAAMQATDYVDCVVGTANGETGAVGCWPASLQTPAAARCWLLLAAARSCWEVCPAALKNMQTAG